MIPDELPVSARAEPQVLGVGGAHLDRRGQFRAGFVLGASVPGRMREEVGGGTFNALRTLAQRGCAATLFSVRGGDGGGEAVAAAAAAAGVTDISAVFLDRATASYTALIDAGGEPVAALADMEIYETGFPRQMRRARLREAVAAAQAVLCDANLPADALRVLCALAGARPVHAIAISPAKVTRFTDVLGDLFCLFLNRREADALLGGARASLRERLEGLAALGLRRAVVSDGAGAIGAFDEAGAFTLLPSPVPEVIDATGAGDALAGGTVAALLRGVPFRDALREGAAAARLAVQGAASVPALAPEAFAASLALIPQAETLD